MAQKKRARRPSKVRLIPFEEVRERILADPEVRFRYEELELQEKLGAALAEARKQANLSQAKVATKAKTTQSVIARLEKGRGGLPGLSLLHRVGRVVGIEVGIWFRRIGAATP